MVAFISGESGEFASVGDSVLSGAGSSGVVRRVKDRECASQ